MNASSDTDQRDLPSVDIVMATRNGIPYIQEQIQSIANQSYGNWRIIIGEDCSNDGTREYLQDLKTELQDQLLLLEWGNPSGSPTANFLKTLHYSDSELVVLSDQDDVWNNDKLEIFVQYYQDECVKDRPTLIFSDLLVVDESLNEESPSFMRSSHLDPLATSTNRLLGLGCVPGCSSCINSKLREIVNVTDSCEGIIMHDAWIALIASIFGDIHYLPFVTGKYRQHGNNVIGAKSYSSVALSSLKQRGYRKSKLKGTIGQAEALLREYGSSLPDDTIAILNAYSGLKSANKMKKLATLSKYSFWKKGFARKIDQLWNI